MDYKKEIQKLLDFLKKAGHSRADIEEKLGHSENYIDQSLARGGNIKLLRAIQLYKEVVLSKAMYEADDQHKHNIVEEPTADYEVKDKKGQPFWADWLTDILASNRDLSQGVKDIGAAIKDIAHGNAEAMDMLKLKTIGDAGLKMSADLDKRFSDIYMRIAEVGTGKKWPTIEAAVSELNKSVVDPE